jgi:hypothetical protein
MPEEEFFVHPETAGWDPAEAKAVSHSLPSRRYMAEDGKTALKARP